MICEPEIVKDPSGLLVLQQLLPAFVFDLQMLF